MTTAEQHAPPPGPSQTAANIQPACRTVVVGCDAKSDIRVFSGSTYYLGLQGVRDGVLTGMINLYPKGLSAWSIYAKAGWWCFSSFRGRRYGFRLTDQFQNAVWKRHLPALKGATVINNFQVFGSLFLRSYGSFGISPHAYVDATLSELFNDYRSYETSVFDEETMERAITAERESYASCRKVVVMSKRSAAHLLRDYELPQNKIHVIPPGANIPEQILEAQEYKLEPCRRPDGRRFVIGFSGLAYDRKGLPTIATAIVLLRRAGYDAHLHIIGNCPPEIAQQNGVAYFGFVDKRTEMDRFIEIVRNVDVGCLLSRAECAGIALLEFLRLGVPIIATDVGGIPDIVELGAGVLVPAEISAENLAQLLARLIDQPDRLAELRERAWRLRYNASWHRAVAALAEVLEPSDG